ncbi:hypothetical protein T01_14737 [Trichinella spiralis]|uniref:Uncharacterized protein n=1 Tax=Trichinella spiralis TaxID=6334 RepID=A0A0V1BWI5_TRISP|nr:hypothetical protein T01_14737 [Trichinella spiralis]
MTILLHGCRTTSIRTPYYLWRDKVGGTSASSFQFIERPHRAAAKPLQVSGSRLSVMLHAVQEMQSSYQKNTLYPLCFGKVSHNFDYYISAEETNRVFYFWHHSIA